MLFREVNSDELIMMIAKEPDRELKAGYAKVKIELRTT